MSDTDTDNDCLAYSEWFAKVAAREWPVHFEHELGLCDNFYQYYELRLRVLMERVGLSWGSWAEYSRDSTFPIRVPEELRGSPFWLEAQDAYMRLGPRDFYNPEHPYGAARLRLAVWLSEQFAEEGL